MTVSFHRFNQTDQKKHLDKIFGKAVPERSGNEHHQVNRGVIAALQPVTAIGEKPFERGDDQSDDERPGDDSRVDLAGVLGGVLIRVGISVVH